HLDAIQQLGARLSSVVSVPEICETIGRAITTLLPYDQCRIYLLEDDRHTLRPVYFSDTKRTEYDGVTAETLAIQSGEGITGWVAETKQGALVGDAERHPKAVHIPGTSESDESMLAVPVIFRGPLDRRHRQCQGWSPPVHRRPLAADDDPGQPGRGLDSECS